MKIDSQKGCKAGAWGNWIGTRVGDYEYITATFDNYKDALDCPGLRMLREHGWYPAWSDMTMEGAYMVLRREIKK